MCFLRKCYLPAVAFATLFDAECKAISDNPTQVKAAIADAAKKQKKSGVAVKDEAYDKLVQDVTAQVMKNLNYQKPVGKPEEIEGEQGSFKISSAETARQEAKEWDLVNRSMYKVKPGFIRFPGTDTYMRIYGFALFIGVASRHEHVSGYTSDYSLFPERIAPVDKPDWHKRKWDFNMLVNESRIGFETFTAAKIGESVQPLKTLIEFDFANGDNGASSITKDYRVKLRHAYLSFGGFLFGQTTTLFADPWAGAEVVNGPTGSTTSRLIQARYLWDLGNGSNVGLALERHPDKVIYHDGSTSNTYDPNLNDNKEEKKDRKYHSSGAFPTVVLAGRKVFGDRGHLGAAFAIRHVKFDSNEAATGGREKLGIIGRVSGSLKFDNDDSLFGIITYGKGPGSYISDYKTTTAIDTESKMHLLKAFGISAGFRHFWTKKYKVRSTLAVGYVNVKNHKDFKTSDGKAIAIKEKDANGVEKDTGKYKLPPEFVKSLFSVTANVMMSLLPNLELGVEYSFGQKKLEDHRKGKNHAIIFSARLDF